MAIVSDPLLKPADFRNCRRLAIQYIYQQEINQLHLLQNSTFEIFVRQHTVPTNYHTFLKALLSQLFDRIGEVDGLIEKHSKNWKIHRIAKVDLAILRLGVIELLVRQDTDIGVIVSEATETAKSFGSGLSGTFVNGILDALAKEIRKVQEE